MWTLSLSLNRFVKYSKIRFVWIKDYWPTVRSGMKSIEGLIKKASAKITFGDSYLSSKLNAGKIFFQLFFSRVQFFN
jgi:hypothetical protein